MKKTIGIICGLTILSSCSYLESHDLAFWKDNNQTANSARQDPMYNATTSAPANAMPRAGNPPSMLAPMQMRRPEPMVGNPNMETPPLPGTEINPTQHPQEAAAILMCNLCRLIASKCLAKELLSSIA